jgi:uncharacterized protein YktB (UPF0637 family)|tara:strand:+ start:1008 stop:1229 length:222 start_codon:yes stop_codon:yes gene_type:complete
MSEKTTDELQKEVQDLKELLSMENQVKKNEVQINKDLKKHIINQEVTIETLQKLNETFLKKIADLKQIIREKL